MHRSSGTLKTADRTKGKPYQVYTRALWALAWGRGAFAPPASASASIRTILGDQATKGNRWMPWGREPRKGVAHDDTPRGAASRR